MSGAPLCLWCNPAWCRFVVQNWGRCEAGRDAVTAVEYHHSTSQQGTPAGWGSLHLHQRRVCTSTSSVGELSPEPPDLLLILVPLWISAVATEANAPSPPYLHWRKFSKWLRKVTERGNLMAGGYSSESARRALPNNGANYSQLAEEGRGEVGD